MTVYGYARKEFPSPIMEQMKELSTYECSDIWIEDNSIKSDIELSKLLVQIRKEKKATDEIIVIVISFLTFGKTINQLGEIMAFFKANNIRLICIREGIDTKEIPQFYSIYENILNMHKGIQTMAVSEALVTKKEEGVRLGRPKITEEQKELIRKQYKQKKTYREVAENVGLSLGTVYKYINSYKEDE